MPDEGRGLMSGTRVPSRIKMPERSDPEARKVWERAYRPNVWRVGMSVLFCTSASFADLDVIPHSWQEGRVSEVSERGLTIQWPDGSATRAGWETVATIVWAVRSARPVTFTQWERDRLARAR